MKISPIHATARISVMLERSIEEARDARYCSIRLTNPCLDEDGNLQFDFDLRISDVGEDFALNKNCERFGCILTIDYSKNNTKLPKFTLPSGRPYCIIFNSSYYATKEIREMAEIVAESII